jgi:GTP cyclohydrolase II
VGVRKMILMSDTTPRLANLTGYGLEIVDHVPLLIGQSAAANGR